MIEHWLQTDEADDVAGSIRHAIRTIEAVPSDPQAWKWFALALHSALQGACVCHLTTTASPVGAVTPENAKAWLAYIDASRSDETARPPKTKLMSLPDLLKAIRKPRSAGDGSNEVGVALSDSELNWLIRFHNTIRNQFMHFEPMGWSIEVTGLVDIAKLIARLIAHLEKMGWAFRHKDALWKTSLDADLLSLTTITLPSVAHT